MKIWVDADACPVVIKEILFKAAVRTKLQMTLVANHSLRIPDSPYISFILVEAGFDVADNEIVRSLNEGDVVITADIPMAAEVVEAGAHCLNPRGELYTADDIQAHLTMRDFYETLRGSGIETGGPPPIGQSDRKAFANQLDRLLTKLLRG